MQEWDEVLYPSFRSTIRGSYYGVVSQDLIDEECFYLALRAISAFKFPKISTAYEIYYAIRKDNGELLYTDIDNNPIQADAEGAIPHGRFLNNLSYEDDFIYVTGNNVSWDNFSSTFRYVVIYKDNGDLVCCVDFENNNTINNAQLSIEWGVSGIFKFILE